MGTINSATLSLHTATAAESWRRLADNAAGDGDLLEWSALAHHAAHLADELDQLTDSLRSVAPSTLWIVAD